MILNCGVGELLRVPWTARRSSQFILKEISPESSLEGLMLKLKLQYFGQMKSWLIWKDPDSGKDLKVGGEGDNRGWDGWRASLTQWTWVWVDSESWGWTGRPGVLQSWGCKMWNMIEWLDWTELRPQFFHLYDAGDLLSIYAFNQSIFSLVGGYNRHSACPWGSQSSWHYL